jgi:hypothetical protein
MAVDAGDGQGLARPDTTADAEAILRAARRPLVIGIGGGGDVVGALASAELNRLYDGGEPVVGGLSWERRPIDPVPGPRRTDEIEGACLLAPGVMLAGPRTRVRGREMYFAESRMAAFLGRPTVLVAVDDGPAAIAAALRSVLASLRGDLLLFIDVGGDVLAQGDEAGLRSPLCDAIMLAAAHHLAQAGTPVLLGIFGLACDAELTTDEVLARVADVAAAGGWCGARGLTDPVATRLEQAIALVPTEASAQAVRAFRGARGPMTIRGGQRTVDLSPIAATTFYLDVELTYGSVGRLAQAVVGADSLEAANLALGELGVRTELDLERDTAGETARS